MKSKVKIRHSILKVIYPRLVIVIISFSNWYLMKSKVKIRHSILKVIYPRGIFFVKENATLIIKLTSVSNQRVLTWKMK